MCGILGLISKGQVTEAILHGLIQLQHRGQDAAGIFTYSPDTGKHYLRKDSGLVAQVFPSELKHYPEASVGIGHVRYSTIGKGCAEDAQPLYLQGNDRGIAISHNGNIVNYVLLRKLLKEEGRPFTTSCDVEVILHQLIKRLGTGRCDFDTICGAIEEVYRTVHGAYSCVVVIEGVGLVAFRDPNGIRPLLHGVRSVDNAHAFASETGPLSLLEFDSIQDVAPGEVLLVDDNLKVQRRQIGEKRHAHCSFEFNYFAKPNAVLESHEVYRSRANLGISLADQVRASGIEADVVVPIPDSSRPSAISMAQELGIPLEEGFVKQGYVGRTFIMPTQAIRRQAVRRKLAPVGSVFKGKSVILTDDSIVRGTVSKKVVALARQAGAKKVYFASTYPPIRHACNYGIDFPQKEKLLAFDRTKEEICAEIGADALVYNDVDGFKKAVGLDGMCMACLTGEYPTEMTGLAELQMLRQENLQELEVGN